MKSCHTITLSFFFLKFFGFLTDFLSQIFFSFNTIVYIAALDLLSCKCQIISISNHYASKIHLQSQFSLRYKIQQFLDFFQTLFSRLLKLTLLFIVCRHAIFSQLNFVAAILSGTRYVTSRSGSLAPPMVLCFRDKYAFFINILTEKYKKFRHRNENLTLRAQKKKFLELI